MKLLSSLTPRLISLAGIITSIYLSVVLVQTIRHNASLKTQVTGLEKEIAQLQEDKEELSYRIQYYQTDAFKEKEARAKLGLKKPGENVLILPREKEAAAVQAETEHKQKAKSVPNWVLWWHFLFG